MKVPLNDRNRQVRNEWNKKVKVIITDKKIRFSNLKPPKQTDKWNEEMKLLLSERRKLVCNSKSQVIEKLFETSMH